jgi:UDP-N-acetylmuramate dehydrogenase
MERYKELASQLKQSQLKRSEPLASYTTFRIGGPADLLYNATTADDLAIAYSRRVIWVFHTSCSDSEPTFSSVTRDFADW